MAIYQILKEALLARKPVAIIREGTERHVCPHVIGIKHSKDGASYANVLLYQFGGYSEKGLGPDGSDKNWRCVAVYGIEKAWIIGSFRYAAPTVLCCLLYLTHASGFALLAFSMG